MTKKCRQGLRKKWEHGTDIYLREERDGKTDHRKEQPMKPFARINLSPVLSSVALAKVDALRRGILVSSLALAMWNGSVATKKGKE
jgi:hypothetical protein